jgi:serine/threonine protein kinase
VTDALQPGAVIGGRYHLLEAVGEGGMAVVWRAVVKGAGSFERIVAIKAMKRVFSTAKPHLEMFLEEARIGAELQHPHLIQVFDFLADPTGAHCLVMEWIEGIDLRSMIRLLAEAERPLPWSLVAHLGIGVLRGLAAAHGRRLANGQLAPIIHRDISPQNILLGLNGSIKLSDFGMARARDRAAQMTAPGFIKGTLSYMAPEILAAKAPGPASDQFALACTLWEALAGERLFEAKSDVEVYKMIRGGEIRRLDDFRPDAPARLVEAIHRALSIDPDERFDSARAMIRELDATLRESGPEIDADVIVGTTVAQAREARAH